MSRLARDHAALGRSLQYEAQRALSDLQYGVAFDRAGAALVEAQTAGDQATVAYALVIRSRIESNLGDFADAAADAAHKRVLLDSIGDRGGIIQAINGQADAMLASGDVDAAHLLYEAALQRAEADGAIVPLATAHLALANVAIRQRDWITARHELDTTAALKRRNATRTGTDPTAYEFGVLALRSGDLGTATRIFTDVLQGPDGSPPGARYTIERDLAEAMLRRGDTLGAGARFASAAAAFDRWRAQLADRDLRALAFELHSFGGISPAPAVVIGGLAAHGDVATAFALAEGRRARELSDDLSRADVIRTTGASPAPRAASGQPPTPMTAAAFRSALPNERTALLEFVTAPDSTPITLFVVTKDRVRAVTVASADALDRDIRRFSALVTSRVDARGVARDLGNRLLGAALATLPASVTALLIVPDGVLYDVPFSVLGLPGGGPDAVLIDRFSVSMVPSGRVAMELWKRAGATETGRAAPPRILAFGDPAFDNRAAAARPNALAMLVRDPDNSANTGNGGGAADSGSVLARLPASADEARLVAAYAPRSVVRLREAATKAYLERAPLDSFAVIHFATHAVVDEQTLTRTALVLAPGGGENGFVTPGDLAALRLRGPLVVLSACRTARGVVVGGEGVRGLTAPLLSAGAQAVVASQWTIGDRQTVAFMNAFYDGLASQLSAGDALHRAQLNARRRGASPHEWGAFVLTGNPSLRIPLQHP